MAAEITKMSNKMSERISVATVKRYLARDRFRGCVAVKKPFLKEQEKKASMGPKNYKSGTLNNLGKSFMDK